MSYRGEVLVTIVNNRADFALAMDKHWYRVPVSSQAKWLRDRWPPKWLALYQTKKLGLGSLRHQLLRQSESHSSGIPLATVPGQPRNEKSNRRYHQLLLSRCKHGQSLSIVDRRRRIIFIPTTWEKFSHATEINDLYAESSLEDQLWNALKELRHPAGAAGTGHRQRSRLLSGLCHLLRARKVGR